MNPGERVCPAETHTSPGGKMSIPGKPNGFSEPARIAKQVVCILSNTKAWEMIASAHGLKQKKSS